MSTSRRLYRSTTDRKLAGVCGGIAEYLNVDATIIRLAWLVGSFFMAFFIGGLILYFIASLIIPDDPGYTDI